MIRLTVASFKHFIHLTSQFVESNTYHRHASLRVYVGAYLYELHIRHSRQCSGSKYSSDFSSDWHSTLTFTQHVKAGCAIINGQSRCTTTDVGWFGVVDWIGLRDSVVITPDKKGNYWCDQCYNHITIYTDFPYTQGTEPPRFAKPKCELSLNILDGGDVLDLFLDYFPSQRTICLGYDQAAEGDERPSRCSKI